MSMTNMPPSVSTVSAGGTLPSLGHLLIRQAALVALLVGHQQAVPLGWALARAMPDRHGPAELHRR